MSTGGWELPDVSTCMKNVQLVFGTQMLFFVAGDADGDGGGRTDEDGGRTTGCCLPVYAVANALVQRVG